MVVLCKEVRKFDDLLSAYLGPNKIIKDVKVSRLTAPGENYGSIMYRMDVQVENKQTNNLETLYTVAKILPEGELAREMFQIQITYTNEMAFYESVVPTLLDFQKELGIKNPLNCFPECYAVRKNLLENSDLIDNDAVLVLENLNISGFNNIDKYKGFDFETAKMVIRDLAQFAGVPLALKIRKPEVFEKKIKAFCNDFYSKGLQPDTMNLLKLTINENEEIRELVSHIDGFEEFRSRPVREPFATLVHDDVWTNNTLQKFDNNGKPVANKLVDFQVLNYGSPAIDLIFFIFSSIPLPVLKNNLDFFIKYYHDNFIEVLKNHGVDIAPFSFEMFLEEIDAIIHLEFKHAFFFHLITVNGKKGGFDLNKLPTSEEMYATVTDVAKEKAWWMIKEGCQRGWFK